MTYNHLTLKVTYGLFADMIEQNEDIPDELIDESSNETEEGTQDGPR